MFKNYSITDFIQSLKPARIVASGLILLSFPICSDAKESRDFEQLGEMLPTPNEVPATAPPVLLAD